MKEKLTYEMPVIEVIRPKIEDIVTSSSGFDGEVDNF